ncbi:MAG: HDOD domain-containing protein [Pseudomonadota bacterium]
MHALLAVAEDEYGALDRALSEHPSEWTWVHAGSAEQAQQHLLEQDRAQPFDVVICDVRLMGSEWLHEVAERSPVSARVALTESPAESEDLAAVVIAHQCLAKQVAGEQLALALERAQRRRSLSADERAREQLTRLRNLPALPRTHRELMDELREDEPNLTLVAEILADDAAMSAKLLQLINSPYFGVREEVTAIKQAVVLLGLDTLHDLATSHALFQAFTGRVDADSVEHLWREGHVVAALTDRLSRHLELDESTRGELRLAAFVHDIGRLALLSIDGNAYEGLTTLQGAALLEAERSHFGIDHAGAGAYVLDLWGLPETLVQAVQHHHQPPSEPAPWSPGWIVALAALLACVPVDDIPADALGEWATLSGLAADHFAGICREASAMVHGP